MITDISGAVLYKETVTSNLEQIRPEFVNGIYIARCGNISYKFIIR